MTPPLQRHRPQLERRRKLGTWRPYGSVRMISYVTAFSVSSCICNYMSKKLMRGCRRSGRRRSNPPHQRHQHGGNCQAYRHSKEGIGKSLNPRLPERERPELLERGGLTMEYIAGMCGCELRADLV